MANNSLELLTPSRLDAQAQDLLLPLNQELSALQYRAIMHERLSQQLNNNTIVYQGLTRAQHSSFGTVMIKWQLSDCSGQYSLQHEIQVLKALQSSIYPSGHALTPPCLAFKDTRLRIAAKTWQLTLLVIPYYRHKSLANYINTSYLISDLQKHLFIMQAGQLISDLHVRGWLHKDIKSSNILVQDDLSLVLTDFALAERIVSSKQDRTEASIQNNAGTPAYFAPERWQGQSATVQSDIYAFGILVYEILAGTRPFAIDKQSCDRLKAWAIQHCQQPIPKLPSQYSQYQVVIEKALAKRVNKRYTSMQEVLQDLKRIQH